MARRPTDVVVQLVKNVVCHDGGPAFGKPLKGLGLIWLFGHLDPALKRPGYLNKMAVCTTSAETATRQSTAEYKSDGRIATSLTSVGEIARRTKRQFF